jgi:hypothetical protein
MTEDKENEFAMRIRHICRIAVLSYRSAIDASASQEMRDRDSQIFLKNRKQAISDSATLSDDFSQGFALHSVVEMLTATGEDQLARETLATIRDKSIKEKATADFLAGPQACYNNLLDSTNFLRPVRMSSRVRPTMQPPAKAMADSSTVQRAASSRFPTRFHNVKSVIARKTWFKGWTAILLIGAFYAAYALFVPDGSLGLQWFEKVTTSDADIRARLETRFTNNSKTFQSMKKYFPQEYESLISSSIADAKGNADGAELARRGAEFATNLRKLNSENYRMAGVESMRQHLRSILPQYDYVNKRYGVQACNALSIGGGRGLLNVIGNDFNKDKTLLTLFDESSAIFFRLAAEGKNLHLKHPEPTDADWNVVLQRLLERGMTQEDFSLVAEAAKYPNDPLLCDASIKWLRGLIELDGELARRIIPYVAGAIAKG